MRALGLLQHPFPAPTSTFDEDCLNAFVLAGRDKDLIVDAYVRLRAGELSTAQRQVVEDYYRSALEKTGIVLG